MCIFTAEVENVSGTSIFARAVGDRQCLPETYKITARQLSADGKRMQFRATGMHSILGSKPEQMHGIVDLVRITGEWKVDKVGWAHDQWPEEKLK